MPTQHPVVRPKIVAPLRNTMRLVDRDQDRLALGQHFGKTGHAQPLGRNEQKIQLAPQILDADLARHHPVTTGVNAIGPQSQLAQLGNLIFHQGDQR